VEEREDSEDEAGRDGTGGEPNDAPADAPDPESAPASEPPPGQEPGEGKEHDL
jgi:hypothetical protein